MTSIGASIPHNPSGKARRIEELTGETVLIVGGLGQDGILLAEFLAKLNCEIWLACRPNSDINPEIIINGLQLPEERIVHFDFRDPSECCTALERIAPTRIFHFAAVHAPNATMGNSNWEAQSSAMYQTHYVITENLLKAVKELKLTASIVVALSSRMFSPLPNGDLIIDEATLANPADYYGETKNLCREVISRYRTQFGIHASGAILFNHESKYRKPGFLFHDLGLQISDLVLGKTSSIVLRNSLASADWHAASDAVRGMWMMSNLELPQDLVLSSGKRQQVNQLVNDFFSEFFPQHVGKIRGLNDFRNFTVVGNCSKAESLGWKKNSSINSVINDLVTKIIEEKSNA